MLNPIASTIIAAMQNQSVSSSPSALEVAARTHRNFFIGYLVWIVLATLVSALLTWMVWRSGNRQQDAAIEETRERTAELEKEAADARLELARIDPINLPIKSLKADVSIVASGKFFEKSFSPPPPGDGRRAERHPRLQHRPRCGGRG